MTFPQLLIILRARYKIILLTLFITVALTVAVSLVLPKTYKTSTTLLLNFKGTDPVSGQVLPTQLASGYMATQVDLITSRSVALKVADNMRLANNPVVLQRFKKVNKGEGSIREYLADYLLKMVEVAPTRESSMLEIIGKGSDPILAASVANGFAAAYQQLNLQIKITPLQQASKYFEIQVKNLRTELEVSRNKLSQYQQQHGLVSTDNHLDVESNRLNELSTQLVLAQAQAIEASSRGNQAMGSAGRDSPDVIGNSLIQNLKASVAQAEGKFALLSQNLDRNHPQYQAAKAEVDRLRAELNSNISATNNGTANNGRILRQREAEVRAAMKAQTAKVLQLNRTRDEMMVLVKDSDNAQRAYDAANLRLTQTELEGKSNQSDVTVLNPAAVPVLPVSPNIVLNTVLSVLMGTMLGLALAVLAEMSNRRIRTADELSNLLNAPMLGTIIAEKPRRSYDVKSIGFSQRLLLSWKG
ncbi:chain length determinant protein EpsF [Glaciimonas sp. CA11.2]|uniref:chain length determinant protein EpsF n=1 Tax=unclassified Glaciimonas TaxID=2644401 RepID=UPI002AB506F9|nr:MULTISPECIES: chain length determinant protein EpsF [unclassified Glaciimonas]MDY7547133.1 chain length determinant protein EpsF [Glaciimonas sp. CA11.2]MEB0011024.1 chain length determinant protein EpsF [Glaciimonas sp. Cout2]MEB0084574.1 chain length determinant protein EpsF [Glaciimonas sp. Gout2]MEB0163495.1 chain length determinant protein EpsF [Glaciimonas sp. CA11.2]